MQAGEFGLGVERIDVGRAAGHEQEDDALRGRLEVRLLRREWVGRAAGFIPAVGGRVGEPRPGAVPEQRVRVRRLTDRQPLPRGRGS